MALTLAAPPPGPGSNGLIGSMAGLPMRTRHRSKQEVAEVFVSRLQERGDIDISAPGFIEGICSHFEKLPTRYALDVNTDSLDVLSHKRLLDEARADPTTVSFAVRPVEVLHHRRDAPAEALPSPAFPEVRRRQLPAGHPTPDCLPSVH
jgi:hypothetical protein